VTSSGITGYAYGENIGWISLSCLNTGNCGTVNYGVQNDGLGNLSGYAWGENVGWINFAPIGGGVSIDTTGVFHGRAWGENIGWITFSSDGPVPFRVKTSWTAPLDTTPIAFTFIDQTNVPLSTSIISNSITVSGINTAAPISITGGEYSINGGAYTAAAGTVINGNTVQVRLTSSNSYSTTTNATLTIGGVSDTFSVTTIAPPPDSTPDPFTFADQTGVALNTVVTSNSITVSGINTAAPISITGGTYSINGGPYTSSPGTVSNPNTVTVRVTSSGSYSTMVNATLTIGGVSDTFSVTTIPNTPSGTNIIVSPPGSGITITFSNVTSPGTTSVTTGSSGPPLPSGFRAGNPPIYYNIQTTAAYTGPINVCMTYIPARFSNLSLLHLLHYENGSWMDVAASNDTISYRICGQVRSLSPFIVAQKKDHPPRITKAWPSPSVLWPPNNKMVNVTIHYNATDDWDQPMCRISSVTSDEHIDKSDYAIIDPHHVKLRAERSGKGDGRIYSITITCTDTSGQSSKRKVKVIVPHDQKKHSNHSNHSNHSGKNNDCDEKDED
jgi:hypothetical protein